MRNFGRWLRTAVCSSIGMFTSPNEMDPFQRARATDAYLRPFSSRSASSQSSKSIPWPPPRSRYR